jgi:hypothetical protein
MPTPTLLFLTLLSVTVTTHGRSNFSRPHAGENCSSILGEKPVPSVHILCPNPPQPNLEIIYSSYEDSFPDKECTKCSVRANEDNTAVFVKCFRCQNVFKPPTLVETDKCINLSASEGQTKTLYEMRK